MIKDMKELHHHCLNALMGMLPHIKAYRRAPNERIAEKEYQKILEAMARIEGALNAHYEGRENK